MAHIYQAEKEMISLFKRMAFISNNAYGSENIIYKFSYKCTHIVIPNTILNIHLKFLKLILINQNSYINLKKTTLFSLFGIVENN